MSNWGLEGNSGKERKRERAKIEENILAGIYLRKFIGGYQIAFKKDCLSVLIITQKQNAALYACQERFNHELFAKIVGKKELHMCTYVILI